MGRPWTENRSIDMSMSMSMSMWYHACFLRRCAACEKKFKVKFRGNIYTAAKRDTLSSEASSEPPATGAIKNQSKKMR